MFDVMFYDSETSHKELDIIKGFLRAIIDCPSVQ